jgi:hypothetical protein
LEEHGNAAFQDCWAITELDNSVPSKQEGNATGSYQQNQIGGRKDSLAPFCTPKHHLKVLKGSAEDAGGVRMDSSSLLSDQVQECWWKAVDAALI